jgi:hypothetical protein
MEDELKTVTNAQEHEQSGPGDPGEAAAAGLEVVSVLRFIEYEPEKPTAESGKG